jgi:hypothetical protein
MLIGRSVGCRGRGWGIVDHGIPDCAVCVRVCPLWPLVASSWVDAFGSFGGGAVSVSRLQV